MQAPLLVLLAQGRPGHPFFTPARHAPFPLTAALRRPGGGTARLHGPEMSERAHFVLPTSLKTHFCRPWPAISMGCFRCIHGMDRPIHPMPCSFHGMFPPTVGRGPSQARPWPRARAAAPRAPSRRLEKTDLLRRHGRHRAHAARALGFFMPHAADGTGVYAYLCYTKIGCGSAKPRKNELFLGSTLAFHYLYRHRNIAPTL